MVALQHEALVVCGICCSLGAVISGATVARHLVQTRHPSLKAYTIRILLMVPIYSLEAISAILVYDWSVVLTVFRSCYEAFALLSFVQLMLTYLSMGCPSQGDGARGAIWVALDMRGDPQVAHPFPLCCAPPWPMGPVFLRRCLVGVFQYAAVMPFLTMFTGLSTWLGVYGEGAINDWSSSYPYLALIQNASQCWALYCLVLFYQATAARLAAVRPLAKFLSIKVVVFFMWWQDLGIAALVHWGAIQAGDLNGDGVASTDEAANLLSNFIVCVEMLVMAQVFALAFPPSDYAAGWADGKPGRSSRYLLQPDGFGAAGLGPVSLDGSINLATSAHGGAASAGAHPPAPPRAFAIHAPWRDDDELLSSWSVNGRPPTQTLHQLALAGMASGLARSFDFWDVLRDMRTMASIGKVPGDLGFEGAARDFEPAPEEPGASLDGPTVLDPTVLERLLGRRWLPPKPEVAAPAAYAPPRFEPRCDGEASRGEAGDASRRGSSVGRGEAGGAAAPAVPPRGRAGSAGPMFGRAEGDELGEEVLDLEV